MSRIKLIFPTEEYSEDIMAYKSEFIESGDSMDGCGCLRRADTAGLWLQFCRDNLREETTPESRVPATQFIAVRESDNRLVGMLQIRHYFNAYLAEYGGHIGYSVRPCERRKGYAKEMLRQALEKCPALGLDRVLITCIQGNIGSSRTILSNGGVFERTTLEPEDGVTLERYWINL